MKQLVYAALLASLLAGCADTPIQDATIEDRAVASKDVKKVEEAKKAEEAKRAEEVKSAAAAAEKAAAAQAAESAKASTKPSEKVETRGMAAPDAEVKSLDGSLAGAPGPNGKPIGAPGQAGAAAQAAAALMDPKNPASPLAQRRILFDYDSAAIRDEYRSLLESHAQYMKKEKSAKAILQGHADERGSREYNLALGQRRAESVYKALNLLGVPDTQIEAVSLGEEKPVAEGHEEEAWKQNRRTEILYSGE